MAVSADDPDPHRTPALAADERAELERLRAQVAALTGGGPRRPGTPRRTLRTAAASLLIVVGCALALLTVPAVWLRSQVTDTDRYVATVAPLARDPALQRAVTDRITDEIFTRLDVEALATRAADELAQRGLSERASTALRALARPMANGVEGWVHDQVGRLVSSDEFARAWAEANRAAHSQLVAALTGDESGAVVVQGDTVSVRLATFITAVKERLSANGFTLAERIPAVDAEFVILQSADIGRVQRWFSLINTLGTWLPVLALAFLAAGVLVAPSRRRGLIGAALGVTAAMLLLALSLAIARPVYLRAVPPEALPTDAAAAVFDQLVGYLRTTLRMVLAVALVAAVAAYFGGPSTGAVAARRAVGRGFTAVRGGAGRLGLRTGPVGVWVGRYKRGLRIIVVAAAVTVLVFWNYPTAAVVAVVVLVALLVLAVVEIVGEPDRTPADDARPPGPAEVGAGD